MRISLSSVFVLVFIFMLAVLGHSLWHTEEVALLNIIVQLMTGAKVTG